VTTFAKAFAAMSISVLAHYDTLGGWQLT